MPTPQASKPIILAFQPSLWQHPAHEIAFSDRYPWAFVHIPPKIIVRSVLIPIVWWAARMNHCPGVHYE
jgi:hypothetical protein